MRTQHLTTHGRSARAPLAKPAAEPDDRIHFGVDADTRHYGRVPIRAVYFFGGAPTAAFEAVWAAYAVRDLWPLAIRRSWKALSETRQKRL